MSDFYAVAPEVSTRRPTRRPRLAFAAFDVLWLEGAETIGLPHADRDRLLEQLDLDGCATVVRGGRRRRRGHPRSLRGA